VLAEWSNSLDVGTVLSATVVIVAGFYAVKGRQAASSDQRASEAREDADRFRENATFERERADALQEQLLEQRELKHTALTEIARLKMATDLTNVLRSIADLRAEVAAHFESFGVALAKFEHTQEQQTAVLQAIEKRLTKENP